MPLPTRHGAKLKNSAAPRAAKRKNRAARALPLSGSVQGRMKILCRAGQLLRRHTVHLQGQRAKPALFKRPQRRMHRLRGPLPVSYTHLDVYKRQVLAAGEEPGPAARLTALYDAAPEDARLSPELLALVHALREGTFCTYYEAVKAIIPYGAQYRAVEVRCV